MYLVKNQLGAVQKPPKPGGIDDKIAQFSQKRGIEKAMPFIVGISGLLTIATLGMALYDRYNKQGNK
jgi:hypothetical protein